MKTKIGPNETIIVHYMGKPYQFKGRIPTQDELADLHDGKTPKKKAEVKEPKESKTPAYWKEEPEEKKKKKSKSDE